MTQPGGPCGGLIIKAADLAAIRAHAVAAWPEECCGVLVGRPAAGGPDETDAAAEVVRVFAADNVAEGDRRRRFEVDPRVLFAAHRYAREAGLVLLGSYHSHPGGPAAPSATDAARANAPGDIWLVVAVAEGAAGEAAAHLFAGEGFEAVPLRTVY